MLLAEKFVSGACAYHLQVHPSTAAAALLFHQKNGSPLLLWPNGYYNNDQHTVLVLEIIRTPSIPNYKSL